MQLMSGLLAVLAVLIANVSCRGLDKAGTEHSDLQAEKPWYDPNGEVQSCDKQPTTCPVIKDPKPFVDSCVSQGFQAKSCGCMVLCSGLIKGFKLSDVSAPKASSSATRACAAVDQTVIKAARLARKPGSSLDRCLTSHVCNGKVGLCSGSDLVTSTRLREAARHDCAEMVLEQICVDGFLDTFSCHEKSVQNLSATWTSLQNKDVAAKKCIRNFICSDRANDCDETAMKRASEIKQQVDNPGCAYWLRSFCAVGSQAW